ncbi:unnamed protein product [Peronospora farinosa]|uniref:Mannosyltransferase n=1 Tax=Peronospora farinosa TaxID=134698 RepID=A0AAV0TU19_9STRA|nr:unnamed protein product [Peronospora farinosa]CAI5725793.1 unnamed protein product [Peronospora farinosa]
MNWWYGVLATVRVVGSVCFLGMVHPDEFFQSQEIMARHFIPESDILRRELFVPWEFQLPTPNRSVVFPALVAGLPYKLLDVLGVKLTGWLMLVIPRLLLCGLSFIIDAILYQIVAKMTRHQKFQVKQEKQGKVLLLFASSWPTFVFLCRPFSNTFETLVLAVCFGVLFLVNSHRRVWCGVMHVQTLLLGSLLAVGFFTRFTFIVFFFPLGVELMRQQDALLVHTIRRKTDGRNVPSMVRRLTATFGVMLQGFVAFIIWTMGFIVVDTWYYQPEVFHGKWNRSLLKQIAENAVIAPINNLLYNIQYDNLELHGVHPRFTHLTVNMPMLFGPIFLVFLMRFLRYPDRSFFGSACVLFPLVCLSLAPHQEPRFMLPAIVPLHLFTALNGRVGIVHFLTKQKLGKLLWIIFNLSLLFFFGMLHQGGVIPMLLSLSSMASNSVDNTVTSTTWLTPLCNFDGADKSMLGMIGAVPLVFAKTYMPPRFLLTGMPAAPAFQLIDLAGNTLDDLPEVLAFDKMDQQLSEHGTTAFLVLPASVAFWDIRSENSTSVLSFSKLGECFPHLSTEDFAFDKSFSLELYLVKLAAKKPL